MYFPAFRICTDKTAKCDFGTEACKIERNVSCTTKSIFNVGYMYDRDRGFWREPNGSPFPIAVKHDVANDKNSLCSIGHNRKAS